MRPRRTSQGGAHGANRGVLLASAGAMLACGGGLLAYVTKVLRDGYIDARPKHAPAAEPVFLHAAEEPFWFYGTAAGMTVLAICALVVGVRMLRDVRRRR